jgi:hypothetical protein
MFGYDRWLVILCILLDLCSIASHASTSHGSTPERCHPEDVLLNIIPFGVLRWPAAAGRAAYVDKFVRGVAKGSRYEARLSLQKQGVSVVHEEWLHFQGAVEQDDQTQRIFFAVPPLPASRYTEHFEVYDACGLSASLSASDEDDQGLRLLAKLTRQFSVVDVEEAVGNLMQSSLRATMHGYHHFYETALARFRHVPGLRLLEIGVNQGESLLLWLQYFSSVAPDGVQGLECAGPGCSHVEVRGKIADECRHREIPGCEHIRIFFGDQSDESFLREVVKNGAGLRPQNTRHDWSRGGWDLVIDDGGHIPREQLTSFCALFPFVRPGGLYVVENIESSYWDGSGAEVYGRPLPGAGLGREAPGNFVEAMKQLVDVINRGWFFSPEYTVLGEHIDHSIASISFHGGLIAVQKKTVGHGDYPFQHFYEKDKARFVDLDAVQARMRWLRQVRLEERVRKTKEEEECLGDPLACAWTRARVSGSGTAVTADQAQGLQFADLGYANDTRFFLPKS